jgi:hypothetical protein
VCYKGKNERQEQAGATAAGRDQGLGAAAGREDQGDPADVAAHHRAPLVRQPQHLHPRLRGLQVCHGTGLHGRCGLVLLTPNARVL